jgi:ABC-type sugar transport system ATPase subunit
MGFSRKEMLRRLSEIEAFADIGEFFDQPVKTYSSGMFVRVAFAAAIHVDPDILVVDEALAVGDAKFQRKCLLQIEKIRTNGATILFVSHSLETITSLCSRAIILEQGVLVAAGEPKVVAEKYLTLLFSESNVEAAEEPVHEESVPGLTSRQQAGGSLSADGVLWTDVPMAERFGYNRHEIRTTNGGAAIVDFVMMGNGRTDLSSIVSGTALTIFVKVRFTEDVTQPIVGFDLKTDKGVTIVSSNTFLSQIAIKPAQQGETKIYQIDLSTPLNEGDYFIDLGIAKYDGSQGGAVLDVRRSIIHLIVSSMVEKRFNGIVDMGFRFEEIHR